MPWLKKNKALWVEQKIILWCFEYLDKALRLLWRGLLTQRLFSIWTWQFVEQCCSVLFVRRARQCPFWGSNITLWVGKWIFLSSVHSRPLNSGLSRPRQWCFKYTKSWGKRQFTISVSIDSLIWKVEEEVWTQRNSWPIKSGVCFWSGRKKFTEGVQQQSLPCWRWRWESHRKGDWGGWANNAEESEAAKNHLHIPLHCISLANPICYSPQILACWHFGFSLRQRWSWCLNLLNFPQYPWFDL